MRKKIALLLLLTLALTVVLAACSQPSATKIIPRWAEQESYQYTVSLADFNTSANATYPFNLYGSHDDPYYKDLVISAGESFTNADELRPKAVSGTFTLTVVRGEDEYDTVTTEQNIAVTYATQDGKLLLGENSTVEIDAALKKKGTLTDGSITLDSYTKTTVVFSHDAKQAPRSSSTEVRGFYVGRTHQEVSEYTVSTTYDYEGKRPVAKIALTVNGGETTEIEDTLKGYSQGSFIDSNQLFMYARSFDKSAGSFADNPSVAVYNPFNQTRQNANFGFSAATNAMLTNGEDVQLVKVATVSITVGGMPFMMTMNAPAFKDKLPDLFDAVGNGPDCYLSFGTDPYAKHTPLRFRVGYISYELTSYDSALWNALTAQMLAE